MFLGLVLSFSAHGSSAFWKALEESENPLVVKFAKVYRGKDDGKKLLMQEVRRQMAMGLSDDQHAATIVFVEHEFQKLGERRLVELLSGVDLGEFQEKPDDFVDSHLKWVLSCVSASRIRDLLSKSPRNGFFSKLPWDDRLRILSAVLNTTRDVKGESKSHRKVSVYDVAAAAMNLGTDVELTGALQFLIVSVDTSLRNTPYPNLHSLALAYQGSPRLEYATSEQAAGLVYASCLARTLGAQGVVQALRDKSYLIRRHAAEFAYLALPEKNAFPEVDTLSLEQKLVIAKAMLRMLSDKAHADRLALAILALGNTAEVTKALESWNAAGHGYFTVSEAKRFQRVVNILRSPPKGFCTTSLVQTLPKSVVTILSGNLPNS